MTAPVAAYRAVLAGGLIAALVAAMFVWMAVPALGACSGPRTARTHHSVWVLRYDEVTCTSTNEDFKGDEPFAVASLAIGFVAVGTGPSDPYGAPFAGVALTSADGVAWARHPLPLTREQIDPGYGATGFAFTARGAVAVLIGPGFGLRTADGVAWDAASAPPSGTARVTTATGTGSGWLAAGQTTKKSGHAALWLSSDGLRWRAVSDQAAFGRFCVSAAAWRSGRFLVVGSDCRGRPAAMTSTTGAVWRRAPVQAAFVRRGAIADVVATASGFVAAGSDRSSSGTAGTAFWTSSDGLAWRRVGFFSSAKGSETFVSVVRTAAGYIGIGSVGGITDGLPPSAFYSATGSIWRRDGYLPNPGFGSEDGDWLTDAAARGARVVAVGRYNDPDPGYFHAGGLTWTGDVRR